eukprot:TRINITY_DN38919_c0_g1_i1.p1 TRINITY_DN38919_c0_g1~~TRINITY_DN38919_c0_g1_i1.p1  ORF type:complete len:807 (+),score=185.71 TRINITY_DN38919_c0_g1_i1:71-2491(+)
MARRSLLLPPQDLSLGPVAGGPFARAPSPSGSSRCATAEGSQRRRRSPPASSRLQEKSQEKSVDSFLDDLGFRQQSVEFLSSTGLRPAPSQLKPQVSAPQLLKPTRSAPQLKPRQLLLEEDIPQCLRVVSTGPSSITPGGALRPISGSPEADCLVPSPRRQAPWDQEALQHLRVVSTAVFSAAPGLKAVPCPGSPCKRPASPLALQASVARTGSPERTLKSKKEQLLPLVEATEPVEMEWAKPPCALNIQSVAALAQVPANERKRAPNIGRCTSTRSLVPLTLQSVQSEPLLLGITASAKPGWAAPQLNKALSLPSSPAGKLHVHRTLRSGSRSPRPESTSCEQESETRCSPKSKKVNFTTVSEDDPISILSKPGKSSRCEEDLKEVARVRSKKLLVSLSDLRRMGAGAPSSVREGSPSPERPASPDRSHVSEQAETLLKSTLRDINDNEEALRSLEATLKGARDPVEHLGGCRHATAVISERTLAVVSRKAYLCQQLETRLAAFEVAHARREEHFQEVVQGADVDVNLLGVKEFLAANVHQHCDPADADKSAFQLFVSSFGLPAKHHTVVKLRGLLSESLEWWVATCLRTAQEDGASAGTIRRLMDVVIFVTENPKHPVLVQLATLRGDVLAREALERSTKHFARDEAAVSRSPEPMPESARSAADAILQEMTSAIAEGAPQGHADLHKSKGMEIQMRRAEKDRYAKRVNNLAVELDAKDLEVAESFAAQGRVAPVGPSSEAADRIELEIRKVVKQFEVPEKHELIQDAQDLAGLLRERDGERKRLANREKRLAEQAAKAEESAE